MDHMIQEFINRQQQGSSFNIVTNKEYQLEIVNYCKSDAQFWIEDFNTPFHERLSVGEQIKFYVQWFNYRKSADTLLDRFDLMQIKNIKMKQLSYDDYVRIKLLTAFIQQAPCVILHEPLRMLHVETIDYMLQNFIHLSNDKQVICLFHTLEHAVLTDQESYHYTNQQLKPLAIDIEENNSREIERPLEQMTVQNVFRLSVKVEDKTLFINPEDIEFIEADEGKTKLHMNGQILKADYTLNELEQLLKIYGFYRCHRSYIVNLQRVKEMITWSKNTYSIRLDIAEKTFIPLSRTKVKEITEFFNGSKVQFTEK